MGLWISDAVIWAVPVLVLLITVLRRVVLSRLSPLADIPGASLLAPYSRLAWLFPHEYRGTITLDLPKLHEKLGPLVRIGPNEVSFYSLEVYDTIHKVGNKFKKDPRVYGEFVQDGHPALFSITNPDEHSKRRRLMGQLFNRSKMPNLEDLMVHHINHWISTMQNSSRKVDLMPSCRALEADIISDFSFGSTIGAVQSWARGEELTMVAVNDERSTWMPILTNLPSVWTAWEQAQAWLEYLSGCQTRSSRATQEFQEWSNAAWSRALSSEDKESSFPNFVKTMVRSGLPPKTALSEAKENLGPGTDTTSASLAHIIWALAHNPNYQDELYGDLSRISFATDMISLESIPRLRACVKEGIRWAGAAAAMLPRIAPEGGVELHGKFIPQGTVLTSSPIWYLRDSVAFPDPEGYDPYRWLTEDGLEMSENGLRDCFYIPFSKGSHVCMGAHFSYYELYLSVSQLIKSFDIKLSSNVPELHYPLTSRITTNGWRRVQLPSRKEWVAAVLTEKLLVDLTPRI